MRACRNTSKRKRARDGDRLVDVVGVELWCGENTPPPQSRRKHAAENFQASCLSAEPPPAHRLLKYSSPPSRTPARPRALIHCKGPSARQGAKKRRDRLDAWPAVSACISFGGYSGDDLSVLLGWNRVSLRHPPPFAFFLPRVERERTLGNSTSLLTLTPGHGRSESAPSSRRAIRDTQIDRIPGLSRTNSPGAWRQGVIDAPELPYQISKPRREMFTPSRRYVLRM
ncbi:hypothetical protein BDY21DRAFT_217699 [Lineolata rhizophorae]|uniref:Uncharacterized protein n=1 Tax=Lineolata rhizophorae TaxID=578093 RepID=A0A6A6P3F3_9PEZI|nr:hypothetical protein BDY21DRAFT_217699 [Lineolata rhizophorae]